MVDDGRRAARQVLIAANNCCTLRPDFESEIAMWVRTLYVSRSVGPQTGTVTANILAAAQAHNTAHAITGVLCQGQGLYLQVLEGERAAVNHLQHPEFDPYTASGAFVLQMVDARVAGGHRITGS